MKQLISILFVALLFFSFGKVTAQVTSYEENFNGVVDTLLWNQLGGANGITPTVQDSALKYSCNANGSFWFQAQIRFWALPVPIVLYLKKYPYISFKAKAEPGATYNGAALDSVNIGFTDNYGEYLSRKIPADGKWYELVFFITETLKDSYVGHDQLWINPGMTIADGHFTNEFVGTVWLDDFRAGKAASPAVVTEVEDARALVTNAIVGAAPAEYSLARVNDAKLVLAAVDSMIATKNEESMNYALKDLRYYMSLFQPNSVYQNITSFDEDFSGVIKTGMWNKLGGENGIAPTLEDNALKYSCTSNGSFWFQAQIVFSAAPNPVVLYLKKYPYISFKAKAEPGATYDGYELDSVNVGFTDNYGEYLSGRIPADGTWHELVFFISETLKDSYIGHDQLWLNPGLVITDGHFSHEFKGTVWIDDFRAGKAASPALLTAIDSAKAFVAAVTIGTGAAEYSQAKVDAVNAVITAAEGILAAHDLASMEDAVVDLRYYMSLFLPNWATPRITSFEESFSGIFKQEIWNTLGGENGITPTFEDNALKYTCTSNGSFWFQSQLRFWAQPLPIVLFLKDNPYVGFKAKADPGATYDGYALDSVNVAFTDNYGQYLSEKIPADGTWHELVFYISEAVKVGYVGHDQMWVNPGLVITDGHFSHEFIGTVWIDDFKCGASIILPETSELATLIESSKLLVDAAVVGTANGEFLQDVMDAANVAIAVAESQLPALTQEKVDNAENVLRAAMSLFVANSTSTVELAAVIDSCKLAVANVVIGTANGEYTQDVVDAANTAIADAEVHLAGISQVIVNKAILDLRAAMELFTPVSTSTVELAAVIDSCKLVVADVVIGAANGEYTQESVDAASAAIAAAEEHLAGISQAIVDQAVLDLRAAMELLLPITGVSVKEIEDLQLSIYPNPVSNNLTVKNTGSYTTANIYSLKGQLILKRNIVNEDKVSINLSAIEAGEYLITLTSDKGVVSRHFIKK
jgi:hypothetical protein